MKKVINLGSGEVQVLQCPKRRRFSADYKLKILAEAETLNALEPARTGPRPKERNPLEGRVKELEKEKKALEGKLKRAEWLLEIAKKGAELMEQMALGHQLETDDSE
ncbi:MAG: hypothetical protein ABSH53_21925 [Holophaga sp.]